MEGKEARLCSLLRFENEDACCKTLPLSYASRNIGMLLGKANVK